MSNKTIDSKAFIHMLSGGVAMLSIHTDELNKLNVFPVADGDTGSNMLKTVDTALSEIKKDPPATLRDLSKQLRGSILLSARGNSGVILSQIFSGICDVLENYDTADVSVLKAAYKRGVEKSYAAVQNPTEGTILTVFRESTEYAASNTDSDSSAEDFFRLHLDEAKRSLERTKDLLPALKEADVIDSGAAGYLCILAGMCQALDGKTVFYEPKDEASVPKLDIQTFTRDSVLEYGYCTELLIRLMSSKVNPDTFDISLLISELTALGGESIVAYKDGDVVKVHVHTFTPGEVLTRMQAYGEFLTVKIENMSLGHTVSEKPKPKQTKAFSVIAVADGDGMEKLFKDMGADVTVTGGQSKNPSIEDLVNAIKTCEGKEIIILPNNKNIILAANQAAKLCTDISVHVIDTKNMAEGYAALSVITPGFKDVEAIVESAKRAAKNVISAEITRAVRSVTLDGHEINEGDYMAISSNKLVALEATPETALTAMLESADIDLCEIITVFVGKNVTNEKRVELTEKLKETYEEFEITVYDGGQDVYDYVVAVE